MHHNIVEKLIAEYKQERTRIISSVNITITNLLE